VVRVKSLYFLASVSLLAIVALASLPQTVFAAGAISEGFAVGEALPEWIGWAVVVGLGMVFAIIITIEVKIEEKYLGLSQTSEMFNTAGRTIKTGLTAAAIVSAWTWAATLLQSSTVAYQYGISGPFWYAAGASIQVLLFGILAIELKRKAPNAHTFLEIIRARYGNGSHKVFLVFALMTNMIVTAMLLLGGSAVVNGLTGMDISLAAFLIPVGVMIYTLVGGLKATFVADYMHTIIIFVTILIFVSAVYINTDITGGIEGMYYKLVEAAKINPVEGNAAGAFLTMASAGGLMFGIINIVGNFGTVFVDQAYWQRAIAAKPSSTVKGFLLGGACWFAIPFTLATTMGLTAIALDVDLTPAQAQMGLVVPAAATALMGEVGAILVLTMLFMAVTSAGSAELIAVSSLVQVSRITIVAFGLGMGALAVVLLGMGLSLGFVYLAMGILIGSAVVPIALTILWKKTNKVAATGGAVIGLLISTSTWVIVASSLPEYGGVVDLASLGNNYSMLFANIAGIVSGGVIAIVGSLAAKTTFDWKDLKEKITLVDMTAVEAAKLTEDEETLKKAYKFSVKGGGIMTIVFIILWPMPLIASGYVFELAAYGIWVALSVVWVSVAAAIVIFLPIIEARKGIAQVLSGKKTEKA
jgi:SSS family transporter